MAPSIATLLLLFAAAPLGVHASPAESSKNPLESLSQPNRRRRVDRRRRGGPTGPPPCESSTTSSLPHFKDGCTLGACQGKRYRQACQYVTREGKGTPTIPYTSRRWTGQCEVVPRSGAGTTLWCKDDPKCFPTTTGDDCRRRAVAPNRRRYLPPTRRRGPPIVSLSSMSAQLSSVQGMVRALLPLRSEMSAEFRKAFGLLNSKMLHLDRKVSALFGKIDKLERQCQQPTSAPPTPAPSPYEEDDDKNEEDDDYNDEDDYYDEDEHDNEIDE